MNQQFTVDRVKRASVQRSFKTMGFPDSPLHYPDIRFEADEKGNLIWVEKFIRITQYEKPNVNYQRRNTDR